MEHFIKFENLEETNYSSRIRENSQKTKKALLSSKSLQAKKKITNRTHLLPRLNTVLGTVLTQKYSPVNDHKPPISAVSKTND